LAYNQRKLLQICLPYILPLPSQNIPRTKEKVQKNEGLNPSLPAKPWQIAQLIEALD